MAGKNFAWAIRSVLLQGNMDLLNWGLEEPVPKKKAYTLEKNNWPSLQVSFICIILGIILPYKVTLRK